MLGKWVSSFYSMVDFGYSKYTHVLYCMLPEMFRAGKNFEVKITLFFLTCVMYVCGVCVCAHTCACMWRSPVDVRASSSALTLPTEAWSLAEPSLPLGCCDCRQAMRPAWVFCVCWGSELWFSHFHCKRFIDLAVSLSPNSMNS